MESLVYVLPLLGCAAMMGVMLWMMRGGHGQERSADPRTAEELTRLRAEVAALREQQQRAGSDEQTGRPR